LAKVDLRNSDSHAPRLFCHKAINRRCFVNFRQLVCASELFAGLVFGGSDCCLAYSGINHRFKPSKRENLVDPREVSQILFVRNGAEQAPQFEMFEDFACAGRPVAKRRV
jgi:hypothetical protein